MFSFNWFDPKSSRSSGTVNCCAIDIHTNQTRFLHQSDAGLNLPALPGLSSWGLPDLHQWFQWQHSLPPRLAYAAWTPGISQSLVPPTGHPVKTQCSGQTPSPGGQSLLQCSDKEMYFTKTYPDKLIIVWLQQRNNWIDLPEARVVGGPNEIM